MGTRSSRYYLSAGTRRLPARAAALQRQRRPADYSDLVIERWLTRWNGADDSGPTSAGPEARRPRPSGRLECLNLDGRDVRRGGPCQSQSNRACDGRGVTAGQHLHASVGRLRAWPVTPSSSARARALARIEHALDPAGHEAAARDRNRSSDDQDPAGGDVAASDRRRASMALARARSASSRACRYSPFSRLRRARSTSCCASRKQCRRVLPGARPVRPPGSPAAHRSSAGPARRRSLRPAGRKATRRRARAVWARLSGGIGEARDCTDRSNCTLYRQGWPP